MGGASQAAAVAANGGADQVFGDSRTSVRSTAAAMHAARGLWPLKTAAQVAARAGVHPRTAEYWLAGSREMSAEALAHLLRSEEGVQFLAAVMARARPAWWSALLRAGVLGGIARRREADLRLLRKVAETDAETTRHYPAALLLQDEDFYRPLLEGPRLAAAGGADRPVAAATARPGAARQKRR